MISSGKVLCVAIALGAGGCVFVSFQPIGSDASVEASWNVSGATPTAESCSALGITNVRVRFFDGADHTDHPDLVFPCSSGGFDTRPRAVLADGQWTMQLLAINADGRVLAEGPQEAFDTVVERGHVAMTHVDFTATTSETLVTASWTIDGVAATPASCAALGVATVGIDLLGSSAPVSAPCAAGLVAAAVEPGSLTAQVVAYDSEASVVAMGMEQSFTINEGDTFALNGGVPVDFVTAGFDPRGTDAAVDAAWTVGGTPASVVACEVVGGVTVEIVFFETTDTARSEGRVVAMGACGGGDLASTENILAAGTYLTSVILRDAAAAVVGRADFNEVTVLVDDVLELTADIRLVHTTLSFSLLWEPTTSGTPAACVAEITGIGWDLGRRDIGSTTAFEALYASPTELEACEPRLTFSALSSEPVSVGEYDLLVDGSQGARKAWMLAGTCGLTVAAAGDLVLQSCTLEYAPPG